MNIKKFMADTAREALQMVKREMGEEAVILKTRSLYPSPGEGKKFEVTAAVDYDPSAGVSQPAGDQGMTDAFFKRWSALEAELRGIKEAVLSASAGAHLSPEVYFDEVLRNRYMNYKDFGLHDENIQEIMKGPGGRKARPDTSRRAVLRETLSKVLARIHTGPGPEEHKADKGRKIFSFVGPTGVGKTTTLAKLAALSALKQGKKTALITLDTFRIAAAAQLQTYARIMGLPLEVAVSRTELQNALDKHRNCDLILIDTAGMSPQMEKSIGSLKEILSVQENIHRYLVLSATEQHKNLLFAERGYGSLAFNSYIFTKLDETRDNAPMINFLLSSEKPVSYLTSGQQVPEDIEAATKKKLASLILSGMRDPAGTSTNEVAQYGSSDWT